MPATFPQSNFPNGFLTGLTVRDVPINISNPGRTFWVYNGPVSGPLGVGGSDGNPGTFNKPFATLAGALLNNQVTPNRGDVLILKPGHSEVITSATYLNMSKAGLAVVGLGSGTTRPVLTLSTANTSTITISANDVSFQNIQFVANFLNIASLFTLTTAKGFSHDNCEVRDTTAVLNFLTLVSTSTTDNAADGIAITRNSFFGLAITGAVNLLVPNGIIDRAKINDNYYSTPTTGTGAVIPITTLKSMTNLQFLRNYFVLTNAAATVTGYLITSDQTTNTGMIDGNTDFCLANTTYASSLKVTAGAGFRFGQNYHARTADKSSGAVLPTPDA